MGTDDGLIQVTHNDGKTWENVTPPELTGWSKVALMDASHFNAAEAYAAVDRHRLEDYKPYIYRTRDAGKTWQMVAAGIPEGSYVNAVKEDPKRKGLLFAGTELGVYVSFDDGDRWQSLQLNLPRSSARDFAIHNDDLIVATHGRGFWVLDDISSLRQTSSRKWRTLPPHFSNRRRLCECVPAAAAALRCRSACPRRKIPQMARSSITT